MIAHALLAVAASAGLIFILWLGDPKRRRVSGRLGGAQGDGVRRLLAGAALVPGAILACLGDASAFLLWLGGCGVLGWAVAGLPPTPKQG